MTRGVDAGSEGNEAIVSPTAGEAGSNGAMKA